MKSSTPRRITLVLFVLAAAIGAQVPKTLPDTKDHRFNTKIPTKFSGKMLEAKTVAGQTFKVYASGDPASKKQILLVHEWWGLNPHIKGLADQFARLGYRSFAVDLYGGKYAEKPEEARKLMGAAMEHQDIILEKLAATVNLARHENPKSKLGTIGWCFGGGWSLQTAIRHGKDVAACVVYYGQLVTDPKDLSTLRAPVLGVFAKRDGWINPEMVGKFEKAMKTAGKKLVVASYEADHAFANPSQVRFREKPARDAWRKTLAFLEAHLTTKNP
ncbi:MAG TPA: dienelactone hydrolase family protein [Planctomycetes bacterium]|nr:dienelactone hydrolase family protein [Planctomycetota bacterium]